MTFARAARAIVVSLALGAALVRGDVQTEPVSGLRYVVVPPSGVAAGAPAPLLVCLHGSGDGLDAFRRWVRVVTPGVRRLRCAFIQAPEPDGWQRPAIDGVARVTSAVATAYPTRGTLLLGYSAGAWVGAVACYQHPDLFEGALLVGSIGLQSPPRALGGRATPSVFWSLGTADPAVTRNGGFDIAALERHLGAAGWDPARWRIDALQGEGHTFNGASAERGLAWLTARLEATTPATDEDRAAASRAPGLVAAGDVVGLRALVAPIAGSRRGEAKALLASALLDLPGASAPAASLAGLELLGALGDPRAVPVIVGLLERLAHDPPRRLAAIEALGALGGQDAVAALTTLARRADADGAQVAAVRALARCGGRDEVAPLVQELAESEAAHRDPLTGALDVALRELTGQELSGARSWRAWREARRKAELEARARDRAASEREARLEGR